MAFFNRVLLFCISMTAIINVDGQSKNTAEKAGHCLIGIDAFSRIEAENYDFTLGIKEYNYSSITALGAIQQGDVLGYYNVNFRDGVSGIHMRIGSGIPMFRTGQVRLHLDRVDNPPFVTIDIGSTGSYQTFQMLSVYFPYIPKGMHDLYFSFYDQHANSGVLDIDWFQFFTKIHPVP